MEIEEQHDQKSLETPTQPIKSWKWWPVPFVPATLEA
jgi:hypothetical protein